jgi:hypothetical protein
MSEKHKMEINYDKLLNDWAEKIYAKADKYGTDRGYESFGTYKDGLYQGWREGLIDAVTILVMMERKERKKVDQYYL